jgi:dihydroorotate dehydrogenase electron transfer subunit
MKSEFEGETENRSANLTGKVLTNVRVAEGHYVMTFHIKDAFSRPRPGQFIMVRVTDCADVLLSRPFSIFGFRKEGSESFVEILYRVIGRGTEKLAKTSPGQEVRIIGPLGRGFSISSEIKKVVLVAGGVGIAPLAFLLRNNREVAGKSVLLYFGASSSETAATCKYLTDLCDMKICTDDGSIGFCGTSIDLLQQDMDSLNEEDTVILACGPLAMIHALKKLLARRSIPCQVSLEERMACGIGACLGCAVACLDQVTKKTVYKRVCKEGPVFDLKELLFLER